MKSYADELLVFISVIDSGSITAAAEKRGPTVSGVSRALTRLEEKPDTALVRRTTRRLQLTEEGKGFLQRARAVFDAMEETEESVPRKRRRHFGRLRVDAASPFMLHCIAPHRMAFSGLEPSITASSGETLRQLALSGWGIAGLADFMATADIRDGLPMPILGNVLLDERQPVSAVCITGARRWPGACGALRIQGGARAVVAARRQSLVRERDWRLA